MTEYTIDYIKKNNLILLEVISGSHAYGLNTEDSDIDKRGIFVQKPDDYLGTINSKIFGFPCNANCKNLFIS